MKKILCILLALLLATGIPGCGKPASTAPPPAPSAATAPAVVTFADPVLEAMVRGSMGKPTGNITAAEAEAVTRLNLSNEWQRYISEEASIYDISGIEYFKNLESLDLSFNAIADITPLGGLKKLTLLSLGGNPIPDIAPLGELTNLKALTLSGCAAQDYSPLSNLVNLNYLMLNNSTLADVSPLVSLTNLKYLYLAGCPISNYFPLTDIYQSLEQKDFTIAFTLAELGFIMDDGGKQAIYDSESASVRINHIEWGSPPEDWLKNCVRTVFTQNDYKIDIGYYPNFDAYVMMANKDGNLTMNYVYDHAKDSFSFGIGDRESSEQAVRAMFTDAATEDVLLAPITIFNDTIREALGMTADALYALPFEPPTLTSFGFDFVTDEEGNAAYVYQEHEPHDMHISIYRAPWGVSSDDRSIEFYDHDVNGYNLLILYFADTGIYHIALFKDGVDCAFDIKPATDEYGQEYPDLDTVHQMFNAAFSTKEKELYHEPLAFFEHAVQERFCMSIAELYALPLGE